MASMAALTQQVVLESSLVGTRVAATNGNGSKVTTTVSAGRVAMVRAQQSEEVSATRRSLLSFAAAAVAATVVVKESKALNTVKLEGPPPPSGGLRKSPSQSHVMSCHLMPCLLLHHGFGRGYTFCVSCDVMHYEFSFSPFGFMATL
jgi:hypothetical protein